MARRDRQLYPYFILHRANYCDHWVTHVGPARLMVDWTARQFDHKAPWPALWIEDEIDLEEECR